MELALGALTLLRTGVSGLSQFASGLAGGGTAAAGGGAGSTALSILQGVSTVGSVLGTLRAGRADAASSLAQAGQAELEAGQEQVAQQQRQTNMRREVLRVLGENDVAFAAAGIDISGGVAQSERQVTEQRAAREISIDRSDAEFRRALLRMRSFNLQRQARSQRGGALLTAIGQGAEYGLGLARRG